MRSLRAWVLRIGGVFTKTRRERELTDEIETHLQLHIDDNLRTGMTAHEARRHALLSLGSREGLRDTYRRQWGIPLVESLAQDLRYGARALRTGTGASAAAMLAISIGVSTAMFTLVDGLLLRPVPFLHADRLANLHMWTEHGGKTGVAPAVLSAWRQTRGIEAAEGAVTSTAVLDAGTQPTVAQAAFVTPGLFGMLGVSPIRGRLVALQEARAAGGDHILLSEDLWRSTFQSDAGIIGRAIRLDNRTVTVVGVLPRWFHYPEWNSAIWRPLTPEAFDAAVGTDPVAIVRFDEAVGRTETLTLATASAHAADPRTSSLHAVPTELVSVGFEDRYYKLALPLLAGAVAFVFLALCANVSSLLLTRFNSRRREFAVCLALGASRGRITQRAFSQAALISLAGTIAGIALACLIVAGAHGVLPQNLLAATLTPLTVNLRALRVAILLGIGSTLLTGLVPAVSATRPLAMTSAALTERLATESRGARTALRFLLIAETSVAVTLLIGSTLLVRSFINLSRVDRGFDPTGRTAVSLWFDRSIQARPSRAAVVQRAQEELEHLPGVRRAAWSSGGPLVRGTLYFYDWRTDRPGAAPVQIAIDSAHVGADFFEIYSIPLIKGRLFEQNEPNENVIVGQKLASTLFPGSDPIGHTFGATPDLQFRVIGVVKEVRRALVDQRYAQMYEPRTIDAYGGLLTLQCDTRCPSEGVIRQHLMSAVTGIVVFRVTPMEETYLADLAQPRASAAVASIFAAVALIAAAGGLFSTLNYAVGRRKREFGIRFALGASSAAIQALVVREGLTIVVPGAVIGFAGAWAVARALAAVQFGVTASDHVSWAIVLGVLAFAAISASWRPARAAAHVDPVALLKEE